MDSDGVVAVVAAVTQSGRNLAIDDFLLLLLLQRYRRYSEETEEASLWGPSIASGPLDWHYMSLSLSLSLPRDSLLLGAFGLFSLDLAYTTVVCLSKRMALVSCTVANCPNELVDGGLILLDLI